jgi:hypothetical protein
MRSDAIKVLFYDNRILIGIHVVREYSKLQGRFEYQNMVKAIQDVWGDEALLSMRDVKFYVWNEYENAHDLMCEQVCDFVDIYRSNQSA